MPPHRLLTVLGITLAAFVTTSVALAHTAARGPEQTLTGTLRTWHGDTLDAPVSVGAGIDPGIAPLVSLAGNGPAVQKLAGTQGHGPRVPRARGVRRRWRRPGRGR